MRIIVDTNVLVSGIFFAGVPGRLLRAWKMGKVKLIASPDILHEYVEVIRRLGRKFPNVETAEIIGLVTGEAELFCASPLRSQVCRDPEDDKFIACALAAKVGVVVSGDRDLLDLKFYGAVRFLSPAQFLKELRAAVPRT